MDRHARRPRETPATSGERGLFDLTPPAPPPPPASPPSAPAPKRTEPAPPPLYTVTQLSGLLQGRLGELGRLRVEGEVAQKKRTASGHVYFDLKDAGAKLACKLWQSQVARVLRFELKDGAQVIAWGRLDLYAPQGSYSLVVDRLEPLGLGALLAQLEERKRLLEARGWFARKRPLPSFPRTIGVVTSRDGAALRDFLKTRSLRWPGFPVRLAHTIVQGPLAAESIAAAIRALDSSGVDVIALVRGGGSLEDLWAFNELAVAEAMWGTRAPVVTGIGHETDMTLADFVADRRAHTPTDAAQLLIPDRGELCARFARLGNYLSAAFERAFDARCERFERLATRPVLRDAAWILSERARALKNAHARLDGALARSLARRAESLGQQHVRLARRSPTNELARRVERLRAVQQNLVVLGARALERRERSLALAARSLEGVSPLAVLGRGYAIVRPSAGGAPLTDAHAVAPGAEIEARLARGSLRARVESVEPPKDA
jgi:exodeoxyribonuclease VII large subunit